MLTCLLMGLICNEGLGLGGGGGYSALNLPECEYESDGHGSVFGFK